MLQGAAACLQQYQDKIHASRVSLGNHLAAAIPVVHNQHTEPFITTDAHAALCSSTDLIKQLAAEAQAADEQHDYSGVVPGWVQAAAALQEAASQSTHWNQVAVDPAKQADFDEEDRATVQMIGQQWQEQVEAVVKNMLLWAQNIHSLDAEAAPDSGGALRCSALAVCEGTSSGWQVP